MIYKYNGITMKMVKTNNIQFEAVYSEDKVEYVYTHYTIDIQAIVNPNTMAYYGGPGLGDPSEAPGTFPAATIKAIRHALLQPRMDFTIIDEAGNELLQTPDTGMMSDAKTGPSPIACNVTNISGARTVMIRWVCEGWIIECPFDPTAVLSNRWSDQMTINEYQLTTRTMTGRTTFNKAVLDSNGWSPDVFRSSIFPKVAKGFQRKHVEIVQNSDGTELMWRVTDKEVMWSLGNTTPDAFGVGPPQGLGDKWGDGILEVEVLNQW